MKSALFSSFGVSGDKVTVIPFGINTTVPNTSLSSSDAKRRLGLGDSDRALLFFGNIAPYKGLDCLIAAFIEALRKNGNYHLIIAGRRKGSEDYWRQIQETINRSGLSEKIVQRIEYIPDEQTEIYFKAADVLVLPYTHIFQSGVLFLGYGFGLPVIAADVGSLREEIVEGETGFIFKRGDSVALAETMARYFESDLFRNLEARRTKIVEYATGQYSWSTVAARTTRVYSHLLGTRPISDRIS